MFRHKYLKYKKKYLELKGGNTKECKGQPIPLTELKGMPGFRKSVPINLTMPMLQQYYGNCFSEAGFEGFTEAIKKIYPNYAIDKKDPLKNKQIVLDMVNNGFTYQQILKSGIESHRNIYEIIFEASKVLLVGEENLKKYYYFYKRAIAQGYLELLSHKGEVVDGQETRIPLVDLTFMLNMAIEAFKYKEKNENFPLNQAYPFIVNMFESMMYAQKENKTSGTVDKFIPMWERDYFSRIERGWKITKSSLQCFARTGRICEDVQQFS